MDVDAFERHIQGLPIDESVRRTLREAQAAKAAMPRVEDGALAALRPVGIDPRTTDAQVLGFVAAQLKASVGEVAKDLAVARGIEPPAASVFSGDPTRAAITDWVELHKEALASPAHVGEHAYACAPADWHEAAQRMAAVVETARRARLARDTVTAPADAGARAAVAEDARAMGLFKTVSAASKIDMFFAAGGDMLSPLSTTEFARGESITARAGSPLKEVRRLVDLKSPEGEAAYAYIFSAGSAKNAIPKGIASTVVDARAQLLVWTESQIELAVGERRTDDVSDQITALANAIVCIRATKDGKVDEATCLYPLAVRLLGGTLPADEDHTDNDQVGQGTWGVRTGAQSLVDIPAAMLTLARLLASVHGLAGGGATGSTHAGAVDGFGLTALARRACGSLTPVKTEEAMNYLFNRAQNVLGRLRTRAGAEKLDWPAMVAEVRKAKITPLVTEQRAENAAARTYEQQRAEARAAGRKSPRLEEDDDGPQPKLSKRAQKRADWVAARTADREPAEKPPAGAKSPKAAKPAKLPTPAGSELAPLSIKCLASKLEHNGAVEALTKLYVARNPTRVQREKQPCPFVGIRYGPKAADKVCRDGSKRGVCAQCDGWRDTPETERVPFEENDIAAVKAACVPNIQKIFSCLSVDA